jgi:hypothetical protein
MHNRPQETGNKKKRRWRIYWLCQLAIAVVFFVPYAHEIIQEEGGWWWLGVAFYVLQCFLTVLWATSVDDEDSKRRNNHGLL